MTEGLYVSRLEHGGTRATSLRRVGRPTRVYATARHASRAVVNRSAREQLGETVSELPSAREEVLLLEDRKGDLSRVTRVYKTGGADAGAVVSTTEESLLGVVGSWALGVGRVVGLRSVACHRRLVRHCLSTSADIRRRRTLTSFCHRYRSGSLASRSLSVEGLVLKVRGCAPGFRRARVRVVRRLSKGRRVGRLSKGRRTSKRLRAGRVSLTTSGGRRAE